MNRKRTAALAAAVACAVATHGYGAPNDPPNSTNTESSAGTIFRSATTAERP